MGHMKLMQQRTYHGRGAYEVNATKDLSRTWDLMKLMQQRTYHGRGAYKFNATKDLFTDVVPYEVNATKDLSRTRGI